jgi:hypothetical protein
MCNKSGSILKIYNLVPIVQTSVLTTIWLPGFVNPAIMNEGSFRHMNQCLHILAVHSAQCKLKGVGMNIIYRENYFMQMTYDLHLKFPLVILKPAVKFISVLPRNLLCIYNCLTSSNYTRDGFPRFLSQEGILM